MLCNMNHILIYGINNGQYESYVGINTGQYESYVGINTGQYESYVDMWNQYWVI